MPYSHDFTPNVRSAHCPSRQVLELIGDKWTVLIIHTLTEGTKRFSQIQREVEGISQKVLTQVLRRLEADGLLTRSVYPAVPPVVEYTLTPLGYSLTEPLAALCAWAEMHLHEIYTARSQTQETTAQSMGSRYTEAEQAR
jgi:DNA-binding HxlR family transcriptional regulator